MRSGMAVGTGGVRVAKVELEGCCGLRAKREAMLQVLGDGTDRELEGC